MKFELVKDTERVTFKLLPGWTVTNNMPDYLDVEYDVFKIKDDANTNDYCYVQWRLTFVDESGSGDYACAYLCTILNEPDGDHDSSKEIRLTVEQALLLCTGVTV